MQKQLYVVCTTSEYTTCLNKSTEHYMNINIIATKKLNTAKGLKILDKL